MIVSGLAGVSIVPSGAWFGGPTVTSAPAVLDLASGHDRVEAHNELVFYVSLKNALQSPNVTGKVARPPNM